MDREKQKFSRKFTCLGGAGLSKIHPLWPEGMPALARVTRARVCKCPPASRAPIVTDCL